MLSRMIRRLRCALMKSRPIHRPQARVLGFEQLEAREVPATIYALLAGNVLVSFDSATPGTLSAPISITGLGANQTLRGIDFRPRTGQLIGSAVTTGSANNSIVTTYRIDPTTGAATLIGATAAALAGAGDVPSGYDFNPTVDRIRYVNSNNENARFNPNDGTLAGNDTDLTFTTPATGPIVGEAYDRNTDRQIPTTTGFPTTLYGIDSVANMLVVQGGLNSAGPGGPNGGVITAIGALGFNLDDTLDAGFDIMESIDGTLNNGGLGTAFTVFSVGGIARLYTINLTTGAATFVGALGNNAVSQVFGIAAVPDGVVVVGSGLGANGDVRILDPDTGAIRVAVVPFAGFQGGVRVATGDVTRDGIPDAIVAAIAPQGHVKVFDGLTGAQGFSFFAYTGFLGTVNVASGDVNADGFADVITVANGGNGHVKAFSGANGSEIASFLAFSGFGGNVTVSAADFDNDGDDEIVVAAAANGHVRVFNANGTSFTATSLPGFVNSFFAFSGFSGTVNVAAGDVNGDGIADIVASTGAVSRGQVRVFNGPDGAQFSNFFAYPLSFGGGASVALADANNDGRYEIRVTPGVGQQTDVLTFDAFGNPLGVVFPAFANFLGGSTVGGTRF
ncbi:MAG: DUF4394 domain-containing protein [Planctomycetia bacterium]|nr:DUF4394 domain-containing protein [Planctomycetia bacterium]